MDPVRSVDKAATWVNETGACLALAHIVFGQGRRHLMGRKDARCIVKGKVAHAVAFFVHQIGPFIVRRQVNVARLVIGAGIFDMNAGQLARFVVDAQDPYPFIANLASLRRNKEELPRMVKEAFMGMGHAVFVKAFKMLYINGSAQFPIRQDGQACHGSALEGRHKKELVVEAWRNIDRVPAFGADRIEEGQAAVIFNLESTHIVIIAMHRIEKGCCPVKSEKGRIFQDLRNAFERPIALIIDLVAGNAFSPGIAFFRRSATYISKHGVSPFPTLQPIVFSYSAVSRRQEGYQLQGRSLRVLP